MKNTAVKYEDWGLMDYQQAWDKQEEIFSKTVAIKTKNRNEPEDQTQTENFLIFVEHPHVYTLGKSGKPENLLLNEHQLKKKGATSRTRTNCWLSNFRS
jgi:lipoyl(octanoyl) transferase